MNTKEDYNPLVSVGVLTYNSSKTVLETLESIKAQTYQNIELIISDDASKDNTVEICRKWVEENKDRFVRCEILTVPENTGIPANANRRVAASHGEWSKGIAADDALLPDCIENFINYVKEHPEAEIIFAKANVYRYNFDPKNFQKMEEHGGEWFCKNFKTAEAQYKQLLRKPYFMTPSMFSKISILKRIKYDEKFKKIEDYPMFLRLTKAGIKLDFFDKVVVNYRRANSISFDVDDIRKRMAFVLLEEEIRNAYVYPNISITEKIIPKLRFYKFLIFKKLNLLNVPKNSFRYKLLYLISTITMPNLLISKLQNIKLKK